MPPGGTRLAAGCIVNGTGNVDGTDLPASGRYTIVVDPDDLRTGQTVLRLRSP